MKIPKIALTMVLAGTAVITSACASLQQKTDITSDSMKKLESQLMKEHDCDCLAVHLKTDKSKDVVELEAAEAYRVLCLGQPENTKFAEIPGGANYVHGNDKELGFYVVAIPNNHK